MSSTLKIGNVVRLKSGGPDMTVMRITGRFAVCQWFDRATNVKAGSFVIEMLELATERDPVIA